METYKISFRPVESFFFGNEKTFGDNNALYFADSNYFPQQTTLLGTLRYRLLEMRDWLNDASGFSKGSFTERNNLIGSHSFKFTKGQTFTDFGAIHSISPVFLDLDNQLLLPGPLNKAYKLKLANKRQEVGWVSLANAETRSIPSLENFDPKNGNEAHFVLPDQKQTFKYHDLFKPYSKVGIRKERTVNDDKAFFKQKMLTFKKSKTSFVIYATLDEKIGDELQEFVKENPLVPMGGERQVFLNTITKESLKVEALQNYAEFGDVDTNRTQLILMSNAYVTKQIFQKCDFAITEGHDFKHLITNTSTKNYSAKPTKSSAFQLIKKGSVFYPKNTQAEKELEANLGFRQIGYNAFLKIENDTVSTQLYK